LVCIRLKRLGLGLRIPGSGRLGAGIVGYVEAETGSENGGALGEDGRDHGDARVIRTGADGGGAGLPGFALTVFVVEVAVVLVAKGGGPAGLSGGHDVVTEFCFHECSQ
jgi:hypothetical protein